MTLRTIILLGGVGLILGLLWYHVWREQQQHLHAPRMRDVIRADHLTTDHLIDEATKTAMQTADEIRRLRQRLEENNGVS